MRNIKFICCPAFLLIMNCALHAQSKDTTTAQKITDKGSKGDIILGEQNKKDQIKKSPVLLQPGDSFGRKDIIRSSRKFHKKQIKKGS